MLRIQRQNVLQVRNACKFDSGRWCGMHSFCLQGVTNWRNPNRKWRSRVGNWFISAGTSAGSMCKRKSIQCQLRRTPERGFAFVKYTRNIWNYTGVGTKPWRKRCFICRLKIPRKVPRNLFQKTGVASGWLRTSKRTEMVILMACLITKMCTNGLFASLKSGQNAPASARVPTFVVPADSPRQARRACACSLSRTCKFLRERPWCAGKLYRKKPTNTALYSCFRLKTNKPHRVPLINRMMLTTANSFFFTRVIWGHHVNIRSSVKPRNVCWRSKGMALLSIRMG